MKKLLIALTVVLASCKTLVPSKDSSQQVRVLNVKIEVNDFYNKMQTGNKSYSANEPAYLVIKSELDSIKAVDLTRKQNSLLIKQDNNIIEAWQNRMDYHKKKTILTVGEVKTEQSYMKSLLDPRLISELSLK